MSIEREYRKWLNNGEAHVAKCKHGSNPDLCIACAHARAEEVMRDESRFWVGGDGEFIYDEDFTYDATLRLTGDFTDETRLAYAQAVADALNKAKVPGGRG